MSKISLEAIGITFITLSFIFTGYLLGYSLAGANGYDTEGLNETIFEEIGNQELLEQYISNSTSSVREDTNADRSAFDIIGDLIASALNPVRAIISGVNFLLGGVGKLFGYIGIPTIINDFITGIVSFIIGIIFLFAVVLGRRDKND